jgi:hypothetical protein
MGRWRPVWWPHRGDVPEQNAESTSRADPRDRGEFRDELVVGQLAQGVLIQGVQDCVQPKLVPIKVSCCHLILMICVVR